MKNLDDVMKKIEQVLNEKDDLREKALKKCRDIIRECRKGIKKVHNEDIEGARKNIKKAEKILAELKKEIEEHPDIMTAGYMENAMQEVAEAEVFLAIVEDKELPNPEDINVSYTSYLLGLADVVGELRRRGVYLLKDGSIEDVEKIQHPQYFHP